jgi:hypothetical protein
MSREWKLPDGTVIPATDIPAIMCAMEDDDMTDNQIAEALGLSIEQLEAVRESTARQFCWFWSLRREPYLQ